MSDVIDDPFAGSTLGVSAPTGPPAYATAQDASIMGPSSDPFAGNTMGASGGFANSTLGQMLPGWAGGSFTPAAGSSLQGALSTLSKGTGGGAGAADAKVPGPLNVQNAQGAQGAGASRGSSETLGTLLAALDARRNLLLQSAVSGQARPVANMASPAAGGATRQTTGLLGI